MITVDFETEAIVGNPLTHPPRPVGVAVKWGNGEEEYLTGSNITKVCRLIWLDKTEDLLFHNAPFDLCVAEKWLSLPFPEWSRIHDTQYLLYLKDPHAQSLSLKPSAEYYLNLPPEEQEDLKTWILTHVPEATSKTFGAYICRAPVELVSPYAKGDVLRTRLLFDLLKDQVPNKPYDRERELMPYLVKATQRGVRCNRVALEATLDRCERAQERCEHYIRARVGVSGLNPHSGTELAQALLSSGLASEEGWPKTPGGRLSTKRDTLLSVVKDEGLVQLLVYTGAMQTAIGTFMRPWLEMSSTDGRLHPNWNQIRSTEDRTKGTRTGRLSSDNPNFQNPPNPFTFPTPDGLCDMPYLRNFILPEEGHVWLKRDWSGQEMRILAHFEDGLLAAAYLANPDLDPHQMVKDITFNLIGKDFDRKFIKETGFGMIYGMGAPGLAKKIGDGMTIAEARELQDAYRMALPGIASLQKGTKWRGRKGLPVTTWGGRHYYAEEARIVQGAYRTFEYKLTNYLIQGSAADQTKQCLIDWYNTKEPDTIFMATVHDEINISVPKEDVKISMLHLKNMMNQDYFDVPMRSDAFIGPSWGELEEYKE